MAPLTIFAALYCTFSIISYTWIEQLFVVCHLWTIVQPCPDKPPEKYKLFFSLSMGVSLSFIFYKYYNFTITHINSLPGLACNICHINHLLKHIRHITRKPQCRTGGSDLAHTDIPIIVPCYWQAPTARWSDYSYIARILGSLVVLAECEVMTLSNGPGDQVMGR